MTLCGAVETHCLVESDLLRYVDSCTANVMISQFRVTTEFLAIPVTSLFAGVVDARTMMKSIRT